MNTFIREIIWWWQRRHSPMSALPEWRKAKEAEQIARRRGCTRDIGLARKAKALAILANMRGER